jgi:hypothetical protein
MKAFFRICAVLLAVAVFACKSEPEPEPAKPAPKPAAAKPAETPAEAPAAAKTAEPEPAPAPEPAVKEEPAPEPAKPAAPPAFDPATISQQEKDTSLTEIQALITKLNGIIKARNYSGWVSYLDKDYFAKISSKENIDEINAKYPKFQLKNVQDYFNKVVVPSHANDRVDDIDFVSEHRVKAYTKNQKSGNMDRLYDLEKSEDGWKIIN